MSETIACPFCQETVPAAALICGKYQAVLGSNGPVRTLMTRSDLTNSAGFVLDIVALGGGEA